MEHIIQQKQAFWRARRTAGKGSSYRYALYTMVHGRAEELSAFGGYCASATALAEAVSAPWAAWMEQNSAEAGYQIVDNPLD